MKSITSFFGVLGFFIGTGRCLYWLYDYDAWLFASGCCLMAMCVFAFMYAAADVAKDKLNGPVQNTQR